MEEEIPDHFEWPSAGKQTLSKMRLQMQKCGSLFRKLLGVVLLVDVAVQVRRSKRRVSGQGKGPKRECVWCLITSSFPPSEGGVQRYLYSISRSLRDGLIVLTPKSDGWELFDSKQNFVIRREGWVVGGSYLLLRKRLLASLDKCPGESFQNTAGALSGRTLRILLRCAISLYVPEFKTVLRLLSELLQIMQENRIKLVHCGYGLLAGSLALILKELFSTPFTMYAYGMELLQWRRSLTRHGLARLVFSKADAVVAVSNYTRRALEMFQRNSSRISTIRPGVDSRRFSSPLDTSAIVDRYGLAGSRVLLTVSHLVDRKGHDMVIRALPDVLREIPQLLYLIVGRGPSEPRLRRLVKELGLDNHVIFAGYVSDADLPGIYNACDLFVMPSRETAVDVEGFGLVFLEASACCKPVIGGRGGGVEDAVLDGVTGLMVSPMDPEDIARALLRLLRDRGFSRALGARGRERVLREFGWAQVADAVRRVNARVLDV